MSEQRVEIDHNYDAFQRSLAALLVNHRDEFALMRDRQIVDFFATAGAAYRAGKQRFGERPFSIQEVTDQPIDLGFWSRDRHRMEP